MNYMKYANKQFIIFSSRAYFPHGNLAAGHRLAPPSPQRTSIAAHGGMHGRGRRRCSSTSPAMTTTTTARLRPIRRNPSLDLYMFIFFYFFNM
jgi:hypothetical protein